MCEWKLSVRQSSCSPLPDEENACAHRCYEVVRDPPAADARPVHLEDVFADGERAVVPDEQELERSVRHPAAGHTG